MERQTLHFEETGEYCPDCGRPLRVGVLDTGMFQGIMRIPDACICVKERKAKERQETIVRGRGVIIGNRLKNSGLRKRWADCKLENFVPRNGQEKALEIALKFTEQFWKRDNPMDGVGLILCGGVGSGKTHLAAAVANAVISGAPIPDDYAYDIGCGTKLPTNTSPVMFSSTVSLLSELKREFADTEVRSRDIMEQFKNAPLTVLDDLGAEKLTDWALERIFEIVDHRYGEKLPIVVTTNATTEEMRERFGLRVYDRLKEMCIVVPVLSSSQRSTAAYNKGKRS